MRFIFFLSSCSRVGGKASLLKDRLGRLTRSRSMGKEGGFFPCG